MRPSLCLRMLLVQVMCLFMCTSFRSGITQTSTPTVMSASTQTTQSMREMSSQMKEMRKQINSEIAKDERASLMIDALRGKGMNDADRQREGVDMLVVTMQDIDGSSLPTEYNPAKLEAFFSRRPRAVFSRYSYRQFMKPFILWTN